MEGCRVLDDSRTTSVPSKDEMVSCTSHVIGSIWAPNSSPSFHGSASMVNFEEFRVDKNNKHTEGKVENSNDEFDGSFHHSEKKRRLKPDQVHFLEKSFDVENKLEPDRKIQLAKEVGLQPRQVAIWFQNRRARYKTKVLEKEFDSLKANYDKLRADYDTLFTQNEKLKDEVNLLRQKLLVRENGKPKKEQCDPVSPLDFQAKTPFLCGDDAATSADSSVLEPTDSSHVFETDVSDFSQDDRLSMSLLLHQQQSACLPKIEVEECYDDLQPNSCNLGFPVQDQGTWLWQY